MDKTAIKNFAVWARRKLIEDIKQKAFEIGITEGTIEEAVTISSDSAKVKGITLNKNELMQRRSLVSRIKEKGYSEVIEEVAYTWFNRFIALRFMEVNDYLPTGVRVLSSVEKGKVEPDIIKQFEYMDLDLSQEDLETLHTMQDSNDIDNLYRSLLVKQCNKLNEILPGLFGQIEDYTEILLPNNLLSDGSVIRRLVSDIPEEDYKDQVEIIGWFYQYYISEKKDEVFKGLKNNIKITKENIPAATQLFTPDWIVKYMVENSLGRLWLEGHPNDELKSGWRYYLDEAEQEPDVQKQLDEIREQSKKIKPEDIKVLDPAMGSGHILVYAFDVLYEIYKSAGYSENDIPKLILEKNLYGLEIDDRAAQLAYFAVMMKARSKSRRIFRERINLNICSIQESNGIPEEAIEYFCNGELRIENGKLKEELEYLINVFHDAKEYGSILDVKPINFDAIENRLKEIRSEEALDLFELQQKNIILDKIPPLVKQAKIMSQKYDVVCTNPPYLNSSRMNERLLKYVNKEYKDTKSDFSMIFYQKTINSYCKKDGFIAFITTTSWMFLKSFEVIRKRAIEYLEFETMVDFGTELFDGKVGHNPIVAWVNKKSAPTRMMRVICLKEFCYSRREEKEKEFFNIRNRYISNPKDFLKIPGAPIAYQTSKNIIKLFSMNNDLKNYAVIFEGLKTRDNERFLRYWHEVYLNDFKKWKPYSKGGSFRKWYGNNEYIINWENDGEQIKKFKKASGKYFNYYFENTITWTAVTIYKFSVRYISNSIFGGGGSGITEIDEKYFWYIMGFLNTKIANYILNILSSTINYEVGTIGSLPIIINNNYYDDINNLVKECIKISKYDWDSFESSWDFKRHPFVSKEFKQKTIKQSFIKWTDFSGNQFLKLKEYEERLNQIFINIYELESDITKDIIDKDVTIRKADRVRDIKSFISYAVGCMFGRYSIDADGLIYAGGEWKDKWKIENGKYKVRKIVKDDDEDIVEDTWVDATFLPDEDNIIPITDDEYFSDDIVSRFVEFVRVTFGGETLGENLDYIAETIGKKSSETSRQTIRRYFIKDFYKDHVKTYQKRPIYWLFDSGKNDGFKALIYMHRYDEFTVSRVRTDYLHKLQHMYEAEYNRLDIVIDSDASEREKTNARKKKEKLYKQMAECLQYDQVIAHVANQRKKIDLDDGVKVNYAKFQDIEVPQGEGKKPLKADLLAKI